jgi:RNase P subunit RPR2
MNKLVEEMFAGKKVNCSICASSSWSFAPKTFRLDEYQPKGNYQAVVPIVVMICEECGHVEQFSVAKLLALKGKNEKARV